MSEQTTKLGRKLGVGEGQRDAIHIACIPLIATEELYPGDSISVRRRDDGEFEAMHGTQFVGIVDPFLVGKVEPGERFWGCLFPNTITGLHHVWTHPMFPSDAAEVERMSSSERWLRDYAIRFNHYDKPDEAYLNLLNDLRSGHLNRHGSSLSGRWDLEDDGDDLKRHAEAVLGISIDFEKFTFSCSC